MSDQASASLPARRSALATVLHSGTFGAYSDPAAAIQFEERGGCFILQADFKPATEANAAKAISDALKIEWPHSSRNWSGSDDLAIVPAGPNRYWLVGDEAKHDQAAITQKLTEHASAVFDLSHGRTIIRMTGANTPTMLAKGTGIDLHPSVFGENATAMTQMFHIAITLQLASDAPCFDLFVARGFAETLWDRLTDAALEFGYSI